MSQNLPPLMPQEQTPTFNLGVTKYDIVNPIYNAMKNVIPSNMRLLGKSIFNPSPVTEQNFSPEEIAILQQSYLNTQQRVNSPQARTAMADLQRIKNMDDLATTKTPDGIDIPVMALREQAQEIASPNLQYSDYPISKRYDQYGIGNMPLSASVKDKPYALSTAIGRANYQVDDQGNVHVIDQYNFPKGSVMNSYKMWSLPFKIGHTIGEKFSNQMPIDINLGRIEAYK